MAKTAKQGVYEHGKTQVAIREITIRQVMWPKAFSLGAKDATDGKPFRPEYERWGLNDQWAYERGRAFGILHGNLKIKENKRLQYDAMVACINMFATREMT